MHCPTCDRTSNNRRVCPHCFTPYPTDDGTPSLRRNPTPLSQPAQGAAPVAGGGAGTAARGGEGAGSRGEAGGNASGSSLSPIVRWTGLGIVLVLAAWLFMPGEPGRSSGDAGLVAAAPARPTMSLTEAQAVLRQTREVALVESQADEVFVSYRAATFPLREEGQLALAERYAEADQVVEERRRRIYFYNPNGRVFAQSDPVKGVVVP